MLKRSSSAAAWAVGFLLTASTVSAQTYPEKPIRIAVSSPGSGSDTTARIVAQISASIGQPVVMDYRGAGLLTGEHVAKAAPDGYTLIVSGPAFWTAPLMVKAPYDPIRDFAPVTLISREVLAFGIHPSLPAKTVKEFIALAKARPGELNYASSGTGSVTQFGAELFKTMAGVNIVHVPYKGTAAAFQSLLSGETQLYVTDVGPLMTHAKTGRVRILGITSLEPSALAPGLPTISASGVPGYEAVAMTGIWAPAKTPPAVINRLNQEIVRLLNTPDVKAKFLSMGAEVVASPPERLGDAIKAEVAKLTKIIKDANIKTQ